MYTHFRVSLGQAPGSGGARLCGMLNFWEAGKLFSGGGGSVSFCIFVSSVGGFWLLHILVSTYYCQSFQFSHSGKYVVVSHEVLVCISLMASGTEHLFMYLCLPSIYLC